MARFIALLAALVVAAPLAEAQDPPIRWGRISDAEKALDAWPDDPDAAAVVLGDVGFGEIDIPRSGADIVYRLRRHRRVKMLSEEGYGLGEFSLYYPASARVRGVKGQTFVPGAGGDWERVELSGRDVFDERVDDDTRQIRFSMPGLAPGAIVEFEYTYETDNITVPPTWYFQSEEPTLVSELRLTTPEFFDYVSLSQGPHVAAHAPANASNLDYEATAYRWTAEDVPALRDEPYTTTEADYVERVAFQLRRFNPPGGFPQNILSSWETVAEELRDNEYFGGRSRRNRRVDELAASVVGTVGEKALALYDLVRTEFVWNGESGGIYADRDLDAVVETRTGSAAELTHLLLDLYQEAGVPATPVILSGRSNGRAIPQYPILRQFDTILVLVQVPGEDPQLVSPTSPHRPYGEVPVDALNSDAWLVDYQAPQWITFLAPANTATTTLVRGALGADGAFAGDLQLRLAGYDATDARERLAEAASSAASGEAVSEAADAEDDVEIVTVSVSGEVGEPLSVEARFSAPGAEVVGDEMYLVPFVAMQLDENPFQRETRAFPVDYAYPSTRTYVADIDLPEGWEAIDLPDPVQLVLPSRRLSYQRVVGARPGGVQLRAVLTIRGAQIEPDEYQALRELYDEVVAIESEALVIARTGTPSPAEAPATTDDPSGEGSDEDPDGDSR